MHSRRGFVLFVVGAIAGLIALIFLSLHFRTANQNTQSHKAFYNEVSAELSRSILEITVEEIRKGIRPMSPEILEGHIASGRLDKSGFYAFFLQNRKNLDSLVLEHNTLYDFFSPAGKSAITHLLKPFSGSKFKLRMNLQTMPLHKEMLFDGVEKIIELILYAEVEWRGSLKAANISRRLKVYHLLPSLTSKFTLFLKESIGSSYNTLITDLSGKPMLRDGGFKYLVHQPLICFNGPTENNPEIPTDNELLAGGSTPDSFDNNKTQESLKRTKDSFLRRGFLYFGPGDNNVLKMTSGFGSNSFGESFHIYNRHLLDLIGGNPVVIEEAGVPESLKQEIPVTNVYEDSPSTESSGVFDNYVYYEGYYETPNLSPGLYIKDYDEPSSSLHVFGTHTNPSRAYTMGKAWQKYVRLSSLGLDRIRESEDESAQAACFGQPTLKRDGLAAILNSVSSEEFANPEAYTFQPFVKNMDNLNRSRQTNICPTEPSFLSIPSAVGYKSLFPEYSAYESVMSREILIPINHLLDFPNFTHSRIPANFDPDFKNFLFPPHEKTELMNQPDGTEVWPMTTNVLFPEGSHYFDNRDSEGNAQEIRRGNDLAWAKEKIFYSFKSLDEMERQGFIHIEPNLVTITGSGAIIGLEGELILNAPVVVTGDLNLVVSGNCTLPPVSSSPGRSYMINIHCQDILLDGQPGSSSRADFFAFLNAEGTVRKKYPDLRVNIVGGLATSRIDSSCFQSDLNVFYNVEYSPLEKNSQYMYRMALDDRSPGWNVSFGDNLWLYE